MDAQAYLIRHGWSGPGNPLNPNRRPGTHGGLGLTKPILVARRKGNLGVGKTTTKDPTNQWWLRGFEDALKGVGDENSVVTEKKPNALTSELYRFFVRGEVVPGTLGPGEKRTKEEQKSESRKRKKDDGDGDEEEDREAKKLRKEERKRKKIGKLESGGDPTASTDRSDSKGRKESKEERGQRKEERRRRKEEKEMKKKMKKAAETEDSTGTDESGKSSTRKSKKAKEGYNPEEDYPTPMSIENDQTESSGHDGSTTTIEKSKKKEKKEKKKDKESKKKKSEEPSLEDGSKSKPKTSKGSKNSRTV
ncbi:hypothetical protein ETB97_005443 [Aspergillus alliaceus]|uniref:Protein TMA23 n=1 Tax=Petromyces alliaceus TaxID=209559 RepID=A0A8H6E322_PETAA|nr:hypothetical protein ETB97_005443 [Aspergillus burnettii]